MITQFSKPNQTKNKPKTSATTIRRPKSKKNRNKPTPMEVELPKKFSYEEYYDVLYNLLNSSPWIQTIINNNREKIKTDFISILQLL